MVKYLSQGLKAFSFSLLLSLILSLTPIRAYAFPVPELPSDNLINNPWFRSSADPKASSLDGWTIAAGSENYWSTSQKESNPSPDIVISGVCGRREVYCGTGARLSPTQGQSGGLGQVGVDAYLYQVVSADGNHRHLKFFTHWVSHKIDPAEVTIYGGNSENGPWTSVWVPFHHVQEANSRAPEGGQAELWAETEFLETRIENGYDYYKIEIHARLPDSESAGFKITGIYFATEPGDGPILNTDSPVPSSSNTAEESLSPSVVHSPTPEPAKSRPSRTIEGTSSPSLVLNPTLAPTIPQATLTAGSEIASSATPVEVLSGVNDSGAPAQTSSSWRTSFWAGLIAGFVMASVIVLVVVAILMGTNRVKL
jgi:hypothetical protein